ncbi:unnamed protein product [Rotaria magnacalcarata]|uniref:SHSP domain-containing protein n=4 Tax=Rotaria TaxID=231623 RepID=A0A819C6E3_9BILA|nr:unnamed protein product [Rotaria magnacalcarata]CAF1375508.1 unnamed protein product [Rotaria magnacalcarata]CAF1934086.1 unnamed protein product [Rotaria magnacalcarata]CAF2035693.1 unnamed protein product [Rotaria magnacalcarata]CAF2108731.1 unnamed protein product [Rotaria magnacalcarata]
MSNDHHYQLHPRTVIPVTVNPSDDQRFIRFRSSEGQSNDIHDRMSTRMRDFEEECRRWREKFFNEPKTEPTSFPSTSLVNSKPRMRVDFPDFPEFGGVDWPTFRGSASGLGSTPSTSGQRAFIEEDNDGRKKYKIQFDIGEFRPEELNVKIDGRMLIVKGDRQVKVGNATESKQFNRELTLPEFVDIRTLQSYLSEDGQLTMEAPVLMDRVYNDSGLSAITPGSTFRQASPGRIVDTTFSTGRQPANIGIGNNQSSSFSSSSSSFRQENNGGNSSLGSTSFHRNSPLRDQYSSTSSASTIVGSSNNPTPVTFSTITARPELSTIDRNDGTKLVTYKFNLSEFLPEDIAIQINDTMLKVSALRQERDGRGASHREFKREIGLPDGADAKKLTNTLSADGILTIQIPVRDIRPPLTPTLQTQQFNLPTSIGTNDSYSVADQQLKLTFDLSGYKPDDVSVKVNDNVLKVQAVHIDNTRGNQINREYMREYVLPEWVDVNNLRAKMSEDSTLTVELPIPHDRVPAFNRQIKITQ